VLVPVVQASSVEVGDFHESQRVAAGLGAAGVANDGSFKRTGIRAGEGASMKLVKDVEVSSYKVVRSGADLAINGAPPMFAQPIHVGRPNIGNHKRFLQRASDILDSGWLSNNGRLRRSSSSESRPFSGCQALRCHVQWNDRARNCDTRT